MSKCKAMLQTSSLVLIAVLGLAPADAAPEDRKPVAQASTVPSVVVVSPACPCCPRCVPEFTTVKTTTWGYRAEPVWKCARHANLLRWLFPCKDDCPNCKKPIPCQALWKRKITTECPTWKCAAYPRQAEQPGRAPRPVLNEGR